MKSMLNSVSGITLIALVVTIVVLLILASVSITVVFGGNGILKLAKETIEKTNKKTVEEIVKLEVLGSIGIDGKVEMTTLIKNLIQNLKISATDIKSENEQFPITLKIDENIFVIEENGNVMINPLFSIITSENYGDKVQYSANGIKDWRVFYNDGKNIFIISNDYLPSNLIPSSVGLVALNNYSVYWNSFPITTIDFQIASKYKLEDMDKFNPDFSNFKAVASLMDTSKWTMFIDNKGLAESAIGSPTLPMWISSWNEKYDDSLICKATTSGYKIAKNSDDVDNIDEMESFLDNMNTSKGYLLDENDNLYYPHKQAIESGNCYGYRLASPTCSGGTMVTSVMFNGDVYYDGTDSKHFAIRPVVCLKSTVTGIKSGDGWILNN